jgi:hypothetical protein
MQINEARTHPTALDVDHRSAGGRVNRLSDFGYTPVTH